MTIAVTTYEGRHFDDVKALWQEAFPHDQRHHDPSSVISQNGALQRNLFLVALENNRAIGSVLAGYDGYRGWLYRVAVLKSHRRHGIATLLIREVESRLCALGCSKINLQILGANAAVAAFYLKLGYGVEERVSMGKILVSA